MSQYGRLPIATAGLASIIAVGTIGYILVEGLSWDEALYMTMITISTVGYGEVVPLSPTGRIFTLGVILMGVGLGFYLLMIVAEQVLEGGLRNLVQRTAMLRQVDRLKDHVILCGYGRFGQVVADLLTSEGLAVVVVESDASKEVELTRSGVPYVIGTAVADEVLDQAGIERARSIVVATASDSDNVFITLAARELNPNIRIHARGESDEVKRRLIQAGAHQVISAYQMGGTRLAASILRPSAVDFLEVTVPHYGEQVDLEEIPVEAGCALDGRSIREIESEVPRLWIVALKHGAEPPRPVPDPETRVGENHCLVVIGDRTSLDKLAQLAHCPPPTPEEC